MLSKRAIYFIFWFLGVSTALAQAIVNQSSNDKYYRKFYETFEALDKNYVTEPDKEKMIEAALSGMLSSLDPHSAYFNQEELRDMLNYTKGEFGGIGVEISYELGAIKVIAPIDDLPAANAGIKSGDYITAVDGESVSQLGYNKAVRQMRGDPGTKVKVTILRQGENETKDYEITRAIVKIKSPVKYQIDGDVIYIKLTTFNDHTTFEMKKAMQSMIDKLHGKVKGIILDMRNNPGGLLEQAVSVGEYFIDSGVILTTQGRTKESYSSFSASKFGSKAPNVPLVVLVNEGSASASEIVAGAIQDHKRGIILGTKSFGKGSVQSVISNQDNSGIKFTIAKYYTPSGRSIQAEGIIPDIKVEQGKIEYPSDADEKKKISEASLQNHLKGERNDESEKNKEEREMSEMYRTDYQYSRAYDLIIGLNVTMLKNK